MVSHTGHARFGHSHEPCVWALKKLDTMDSLEDNMYTILIVKLYYRFVFQIDKCPSYFSQSPFGGVYIRIPLEGDTCDGCPSIGSY